MDILNADEVKTFIEQINRDQNTKRKKLVNDGHRIANGDLEFYVKRRLKDLWPKSYTWFRNPNASLTGKVLNRIAKSYDEVPDRILKDDKETDYYQTLIENGDASLEKAMAEFDKTYIIDHYAAIWISINQEDEGNKYVFRGINQSSFDRKVNSKTLETEAVIISMSRNFDLTTIHGDGELSDIQDEPEDKDGLNYYALWTDKNHVLVTHDAETGTVKHIPIDGNEGMINPIGKIPFVFLQDGDVTQLPPRPSLPSNDVELNSCKAVLLSGCDIRALGKLVIKHPTEQEIPDAIFDSPFTYLALPQLSDPDAAETTAEYVNDSTNVSDFKEVISEYENDLLEDQGIVTGTVGNVKFTSAEDRELALKSENDRIKKNQSKYAKVEKGVYCIVKAYEDSLNNSQLTSDDIAIRYPKQQPIKSREQLLKEIEKEIQLGTMEPWEKHVRLNPNLTRKEAEKKEAVIQALDTENIKGFLNGEGNNKTPETKPKESASRKESQG